MAAAGTCAQVLYHAAIILRSEMKGATGIETQPLNVSDISIQKATAIFKMVLAISDQRAFEGEGLPIDDHKNLNENVLKESQRIERDENDANNIIIHCIETKLVNPFDIGQCEGEKMPLINNVTGAVAPSEVSESLLSAKEQDEKAMGEFVQARLISDKENFWDPSKPFRV